MTCDSFTYIFVSALVNVGVAILQCCYKKVAVVIRDVLSFGTGGA